MTTESRLRKFITENLLFSEDDLSLSDDDSLIAQGVIDSTGIMELVDFVAREFHLEIPVTDINQHNFDSISRLAAYIGRRKQKRDAVGQPVRQSSEVLPTTLQEPQ